MTEFSFLFELFLQSKHVSENQLWFLFCLRCIYETFSFRRNASAWSRYVRWCLPDTFHWVFPDNANLSARGLSVFHTSSQKFSINATQAYTSTSKVKTVPTEGVALMRKRMFLVKQMDGESSIIEAHLRSTMGKNETKASSLPLRMWPSPTIFQQNTFILASEQRRSWEAFIESIGWIVCVKHVKTRNTLSISLNHSSLPAVSQRGRFRSSARSS